MILNTCRQEEFEKSAAGRAARAQLAANAKQSANTNKGEPVLKVIMLSLIEVVSRYFLEHFDDFKTSLLFFVDAVEYGVRSCSIVSFASFSLQVKFLSTYVCLSLGDFVVLRPLPE